jgi:hypothetical protein
MKQKCRLSSVCTDTIGLIQLWFRLGFSPFARLWFPNALFMPFSLQISRLINMSTSGEVMREKECSTMLRYVLVFVLALCALGVVVFGAAAAHSSAMPRRPMRTVLPGLRSAVSHDSSAPKNHGASQETVGFEDEESLSAAAVVNENLSASTRYTVRVRLSGGDEQVISITAPPGGLQLEVRDMTGDDVRNDLVLRPALIHWPLIVLLNDGHDHFTVAISATLPSSVDSGSRASRSRQRPETAALTSSSPKAGPQASSRQILGSTLQRAFLPPLAQRVANQLAHRSVLGRAPPAFATLI